MPLSRRQRALVLASIDSGRLRLDRPRKMYGLWSGPRVRGLWRDHRRGTSGVRDRVRGRASLPPSPRVCELVGRRAATALNGQQSKSTPSRDARDSDGCREWWSNPEQRRNLEGRRSTCGAGRWNLAGAYGCRTGVYMCCTSASRSGPRNPSRHARGMGKARRRACTESCDTARALHGPAAPPPSRYGLVIL